MKLGLVLARETVGQVKLDVLALDLLETLVDLPVLVEVGEAVANVVDEELGQLFVVFDYVAKELAEPVVDDASELLLEGERLKVFPLQVAGLEGEHAVV